MRDQLMINKATAFQLPKLYDRAKSVGHDNIAAAYLNPVAENHKSAKRPGEENGAILSPPARSAGKVGQNHQTAKQRTAAAVSAEQLRVVFAGG